MNCKLTRIENNIFFPFIGKNYELILLNIFIFFGNKKEPEKIEAYYKLCNRGKLINKKNFKRVENPKVSIVSPIHNREKYILRLIRSVQNQLFDDIEIILVDDFSTDRSVELTNYIKYYYYYL